MKPGAFCISIDVELLWGQHDRDWKKFVPVITHSRSIIRELLELLEHYKMGATWAIVGHLFLDSCNPVKNNPGWYGRDIVRLIKKYPRQEIACHSFSHVIFGDPGCSRKCAESEIKTCIGLAKKEGVKLSSFIFPRNTVGHLDVLKEYGFTAYRGPEPSKSIQLLSILLPLKPPVVDLIDHHGIWEILPSFYFVSARGLRRLIPDSLILKKTKLGIDRAVAQGKIFHLWLHPEDLYWNRREKFLLLEKIISYARTKRAHASLDILSMRDSIKRVGL